MESRIFRGPRLSLPFPSLSFHFPLGPKSERQNSVIRADREEEEAAAPVTRALGREVRGSGIGSNN